MKFLPTFLGHVLLGGALTFSVAVQASSLGNAKTILTTQSDLGLNTIRIQTERADVMEIAFLRPDLFRVQVGMQGQFLPSGDKAAPIVLKQDFAPISVAMIDGGDYQLVRTSELALRIYRKPLRLALYRADNRTRLWEETQSLDIGEQTSFQTLSASADEHFMGGGQQNGHYSFKGKTLEISYSGGWEENDRPSPAPFYMSSKGYGVLRNTWSNGSYDFRANDYLTATHKEKRFDAYYFVGPSFKEVLNTYTQLTGRARILPRWAYEYGDADCYNDGDNIKKPGTVPKGWSDGPTGKTPDVILSVAAKYREHDMPGGWILPNDGYGCAYTDLPAVVAGLKKYGFRTGLWTENGVDKIKWEVGTAGTRVQKLDVAWTGKGYQFALDANQAAAQGILDNANSRPFLWTVMGWAGMQRYAVTWTGDQSGSWDYIRWHIPTLIGSGLSGQAYATGDVDGIFGGSPETYTRDLQWKSFTPVLMGMSGWSQNVRKHPWWFDEPYRSINRDYLKLKMRLMPYMYTTAYETENTGAPIVRGLMWDHPQDRHAYSEQYPNQFFLGRDFLIAPVMSSQAVSQGWRKSVYLPQSEWIDYWDGRVVHAEQSGKTIDVQVGLDKLPVFVRAGAIIPMYPSALYDGQVAKDLITWDIYPQAESHFSLLEDDGETRQYLSGEKSKQEIKVAAPDAGKSGDIQVALAGVEGQYQGMEMQRAYHFMVHTRVAPNTVMVQERAIAEVKDAQQFEQAQTAWRYDAQEKYGVLHIKIAKMDVRAALTLAIKIDANSQLAQTADYPAAPALGNRIASDSLMVVNRPAEEPGHPLENAFDGKPGTWFRINRDQAQKTGAYEFTVALGERRMIKGFEITPRNDQHWQHGQAKEVEVYLADSNGEWGKPVYQGSLKQLQTTQTIEFKPKAGRLFRFRILGTYDQGEDGNAQDPMVLASNQNEGSARAFNALQPLAVTPITMSEFAILEHRVTDRQPLQVALSDQITAIHSAANRYSKDKVHSPHTATAQAQMQMNGLKFRKGLGVGEHSELAYHLKGDWHTFRADVGIDDACRQVGGLQFQVWGDGRLLFDSGLIKAPAVVKPELDIRGIEHLLLKTTGAQKTQKASLCANWANATLLGFEGDQVQK